MAISNPEYRLARISGAYPKVIEDEAGGDALTLSSDGLAILGDVSATGDIVTTGHVEGRQIDAGGTVYNLQSDLFGGWTGAVFDAETALRAAAAYFANGANAGTLLIPPGTYTLSSYRTALNGVTNIRWVGCTGLKVSAYGARFDVFGAFNRTAAGAENSLNPFEFVSCTDLAVEGFEVDGNVDLMTRESGLVEGDNHGLLLFGCRRVRLQDLYLHHCASDGYYLKDASVDALRYACRDLTVINVRSEYNARQGLSIIQLHNADFYNCTFRYTGRAAGTYGAHSPSAGVDIEPNRTTADGLDINTGSIRFHDCISEHNNGATLLAALPNHISDVRWMRGALLVGDGDGLGGSDGLIMDCPGFVIEDAEIDMRSKRLYATWTTNATAWHVLRRCRIRGTERILTSTATADVLMEDCKIIGEHTGPFTSYAPYVQNLSFRARRCTITLPAAAHEDGVGGQTIVQWQVGESEETTFAVSGGAPVDGVTAHFAPIYSGSTQFFNDHYPTDASFRPSVGSTWDNTRPWTGRRSRRTLGGLTFGMAAGVSQAWNPPSLAAGTQQSTTVAVPGALMGDMVLVSFSVTLEGTQLWGAVTAADVVTVYQRNGSLASVDVASGTLYVVTLRPQ